MPLILIRHTRVADAEGLCYGRTDVALADSFEREASEALGRIGILPRLVVTSPARRCRMLARRLAPGVEATVDERLREFDFGRWEGRRWADLPREEVDHWLEDFVNRRAPGGESFGELASRVDRARKAYEGADALIVTHAGVIKAWRCLTEGLPLRMAMDYEVAHAAPIRVPNWSEGQVVRS